MPVRKENRGDVTVTDDIRFNINPLKLHEEWRDQPDMMSRAVRMAAECQKEYDKAAENLKFVQARLSLSVRKSPSQYGLEKVTDSSVDAVIAQDFDCRAAERVVIDAKEKRNVADGVVVSLEHRKRALTKMVDLWIHDYYSEPMLGTARTASQLDRARVALSERPEQQGEDRTEDDE